MADYLDTVREVREANDIVSVIGQYVKLEKKGANYFGLCPFHGEKTASFSVSPRKQICYCFGCQKGGDVIKFISEYEQVSFKEAVKILADRAHITLPEERVTPEAMKRKELRERLLGIQKEAAYFYHDRLMMPDGAPGLEYLSKKRQLGKGTITHFGLGYSGKGTGELYRVLKDKGYTDAELKESGLFTITEQGTKEKFWNRVMFPIMDLNNRVIGFGGRVMGEALPKYLNSPETLLFNKSTVLYGLNFARHTKEKYLLLCEGYMDVISLHQAGFTNAVASLGTAFTPSHASLLKRFTDTVILTQDSDEAGINAKIKAFPVLHDAGLNVKILDMSPFKDPDEFIKANGPAAYEERIQQSKNAFLYIINVIRKNYDFSDPQQVTAYYNDVAHRLAYFKDPVERKNYLEAACREQVLDEGLLTGLTERFTLNGEGTGILRDSQQKLPDRRIKTTSFTKKTANSEDILLYYMVSDDAVKKAVFRVLSPEDFTGAAENGLAKKLSTTEGALDANSYLDSIEGEEELYRDTNAILVGNESFTKLEEDSAETENLEKLLTDAVRNVKQSSIERKMQQETAAAEYQKLLREKMQVKKITIHIQNADEHESEN